MPSSQAIEVAFSSPVSGHMILAFYQVSDSEGLKMAPPMQISNPESAAKLSLLHIDVILKDGPLIFNTKRPWPWGIFHFWGMIQPRRQDQTDLFQRKEAWVAYGEGEEKQTGLRAEQVSQLLGCRGREQKRTEGACLHRTGRPLTHLSFLKSNVLI